MKIEKINIALVGFGNIGSYFFKTLNKNKKNISIKTGKIPIIKYISVKNIKKKRNISLPKSKYVKNPLTLVNKNDVNFWKSVLQKKKVNYYAVFDRRSSNILSNFVKGKFIITGSIKSNEFKNMDKNIKKKYD